MTKLHELAGVGQAIWLDYIRRSFITSGELSALIDQGLRGVTSNPTIFEKAIAGSHDYDHDLQTLVGEGKSVTEIYEALTIDDIGRAADVLRSVYDETKGADGFVSLEVSPKLAHDTEGTVLEARRLFSSLGRRNVMIKVPATPAGIPAIETLIGDGINVNATLIFSISQYETVAKAYIAGLEKLMEAGGDLSRVASVASFFVSRVDSAVDRELEKLGNSDLQGKIAIANSKIAYARFRELFAGPRWEKLVAAGAVVQRPLWASTSAKNPLYPDTLYVDNLIGDHTVNTLPPATLQALLDHGKTEPAIESGVDEARAQLAELADLGIDLHAITEQLQADGVASFARSFKDLRSSVAAKRDHLLAGGKRRWAKLGMYQPLVDMALRGLVDERVMARIWEHDHTVWKPEPAEITNRLGWLHIADAMTGTLPRLADLVEDVRAAGYTHALLLGMGGSSLGPEMFRNVFGVADGHLDLEVLDSTSPATVLAHAERLDLSRTLFIVSTKSGGTVETLSFLKFFYNRVIETLGADEAGEHFIAITDPGSKLAHLAVELSFRATFLNDPNIGGRYSALSHFGMVPAALGGVDVAQLLDRAMRIAVACEPCVGNGQNPAAWLGTIMGVMYNRGRDKLTLITSPAIASFGDWVEQLIAESTGKEGKGILPVVGEELGAPADYGDDRFFVYLHLEDDHTYAAAVEALETAGHPVVHLHLENPYDLGEQIFLWEMATAVTGHYLSINPFDQPNVEAAKVVAREMMAEYQEIGALPAQTPALVENGIRVYGDVTGDDVGAALNAFLSVADPEGYVTLQAYLRPTGETDEALRQLRARLAKRTHLATTMGYGPRFLHSTGQLHKGDAGNGLFVQLTADEARDAPIPDEPGSPDSSISFGVLIAAQALGDQQALRDAGRQVIRFHLVKDIAGGLRRLADALV